MKRCLWLYPVLLLALLVVLPAAGAEKSKGNGKSLYQQGQKAEARQDYEEAYRCYKKLYDEHPERTEYRSAYERTKFLASASHVHKGQVLREAGKLSEALTEFQLAAMIDPSSVIAKQEIQHTQKLIEKAQQPATPISRAPHEAADSSQNLAGPVELAPISQTPITLKMSEDSKVVYETIGKLAGVNVLFDPAYAGKRIKVELNGVSLVQALQVTALLSKTFWRPVTANTIFIAEDTSTKRQELEQQVLRTFYLNNFSTVSELQDVANLIRTILKVEKVQQFPSQNAIIMRGTPDQAALAELLINNLDKAKSEVVVDVVVMQVSKDKVKQLGLLTPFQGGTSNPSITIQSPSTSSTSSTTTVSGSSSSNTLTLNNFIHLNATDFTVNIPSMNVAMMMSDSNTTILQRPQMRSVDGQKATLKIGQRVPVATGTSSSTLTSTALTQTQFQYQDVGVNIEMTPHIHGNGDVSLKISLEVSDIDSYQSIGGLSEPVIGQRKVDLDIRLRDGEVNLIGGIMEHQDVKSMNGLPWLSQIPGLKYLFGQSNKELKDTETVFALMPHIVRRLDLDDISLRSVEVGTQNVVEVRRVSRPDAAPVASVPSATPAPVAGTPVPPATPGGKPVSMLVNAPAAQAVTPAMEAAAPQAGMPAVLSLDPPVVNQPSGATFTINVILNGGQNIFSVPAQISYDSKLLQVLNVSNSGGLSRDGAAVSLVHRDDTEHGLIQVSMLRPPGSPGVTPQGVLFTITFQAKAAGQATVVIGPSVLKDPNQGPVPASGSQAIVTIR